jgi:hypothetical protein
MDEIMNQLDEIQLISMSPEQLTDQITHHCIHDRECVMEGLSKSTIPFPENLNSLPPTSDSQETVHQAYYIIFFQKMLSKTQLQA